MRRKDPLCGPIGEKHHANRVVGRYEASNLCGDADRTRHDDRNSLDALLPRRRCVGIRARPPGTQPSGFAELLG